MFRISICQRSAFAVGLLYPYFRCLFRMHASFTPQYFYFSRDLIWLATSNAVSVAHRPMADGVVGVPR